ncbi:MAG TPA: type VII secretion-associated serine protease, partial [Mycobacteriales bacterium]|nr:type VII secretion-associated serine protease [Mycobacteriales bacterium]
AVTPPHPRPPATHPAVPAPVALIPPAPPRVRARHGVPFVAVPMFLAAPIAAGAALAVARRRRGGRPA